MGGEEEGPASQDETQGLLEGVASSTTLQNDQEEEEAGQESKIFKVGEEEPLKDIAKDTATPIRQQEGGVPIMVTVDPVDRASLNTACTMSTSLSPDHQHRTAHGFATSASGCQLSLRPTMNNPATQMVCPMTSTVSVRPCHAKSAEESAIQVADSPPPDPGLGCSGKTLCGPHPKKITVVVFLILSIWVSFILGVNIHKKVITMEDRLTGMTQKMLDMQVRYLEMQESSHREVGRLHTRIDQLLSRTASRRRSRPKSVPAGRRSHQQTLQVDKRSRVVTKAAPEETTTKEPACTTEDGELCVFPFKYEGKEHDGCVQGWTDSYRWCATGLDESGTFSKPSKKWGTCASHCKMSTKNENWFLD